MIATNCEQAIDTPRRLRRDRRGTVAATIFDLHAIHRTVQIADWALVMHIEMHLDRAALRVWHLRLVERLRQIPEVHVTTRWGRTAEPLPPCVNLLFALERLINGLPQGGPASPS